MSDISNGDLMQVLLTIQKDVTESKTKTGLLLDWAKTHSEEDKAAVARIENLEQSRSRIKWMASGVALVAGAAWKGIEVWFGGSH